MYLAISLFIFIITSCICCKVVNGILKFVCIFKLLLSFTCRYVVRAKAGKKQSTKDASGRAAHSAGASLRRYNELALKKVFNQSYIAFLANFFPC